MKKYLDQTRHIWKLLVPYQVVIALIVATGAALGSAGTGAVRIGIWLGCFGFLFGVMFAGEIVSFYWHTRAHHRDQVFAKRVFLWAGWAVGVILAIIGGYLLATR